MSHNTVAAAERPTSRGRTRENFDVGKAMDSKCTFHPNASHTLRECFKFQCILKGANEKPSGSKPGDKQPTPRDDSNI